MTSGRWSAEESSEIPRQPLPLGKIAALVLGVVALAGLVVAVISYSMAVPPHTPYPNRSDQAGSVRTLNVWWGDIPRKGTVASQPVERPASNIHPEDYAGPDACRECHRKNYDNWSRHPHRWMNAEAKAANVKGDFSGKAVSFQGGEATFYVEKGQYRMKLVREDERIYRVKQTIGSRFFQYYVGTQISGPEPPVENVYLEDHVLPFGYWLGPQEWVPIVHIAHELPDGRRVDPFSPLPPGEEFVDYARGCNVCHTTFALGDLLCKETKQMAREVPVNLHWSAANYLEEVRPEILPKGTETYRDGAYVQLLDQLKSLRAPEYALNLGVSCEACHLGAKAHAEHPETKPTFFPASPYLRVDGEDEVDNGRTHRNLNWICGRCHSGDRPQFAAGMSTWNSTEYADAMRGSCYSQLKCVDCHDPHTPIGPKWARSPAEDDAKCIGCHQQYESPAAQTAHTHHPAGSEGSRCMNCHMPRLNEGMEDVVRTHTIFSPTNREMIHANQPNACNQCHPEKPIDWTLRHLAEWYGATFDNTIIANSYPARLQPAAIGWLHSENEAVRLVAADALFRTHSDWALKDLIGALDDPYLLNRQFARIGIEKMKNVRLEADFGYRFFMTPGERRQPIERVREALLGANPSSPEDPPPPAAP